MDTHDELAPILALDDVRGEVPVTQSPGHSCSHWRAGVALDPETRTARCRSCDAVVDPYDALEGIARVWGQKWKWEINRLDAELHRKRAAVEALKREEKAAKARLRRARG